MKRKPRTQSRWTFPYAVPKGISVYKPAGSSDAVSWYVAYVPALGHKRKVERPGPDAKLVHRLVMQIALQQHDAAENPQLGRLSMMDRKPLLGHAHLTPGDSPGANSGHLEDYRQVLRNEGSTAKHADQIYSRARRVIEACGFARISDVSPSIVLDRIAGLTDLRQHLTRGDSRQLTPGESPGANYMGYCPHCNRGHNRSRAGACARCAKRLSEGRSMDPALLTSGPAPISLQSRNHYLQAIKQFSAWLAGPERRAKEDLLKHLAAWNVSTDRRHDRQDLGEAGAAALIEAARTGPAIAAMSGEDRSWLFETAVETGFRANELGTLVNSKSIFRLGDEHPVIVVLAAFSKHRREDHQPVRREFAARLAAWLKTRPLNKPVWRMPADPVDLVRGDLERAGLRYEDEEGRFADFHALRHTYVCRLVRSREITAKECQLLARHASIETTMKYYAHLKLTDTAGAVGRMPPLPPLAPLPLPSAAPSAPSAPIVAPAQVAVLKATGTDDVTGLTAQAQREAQRLSVPRGPSMSLGVPDRQTPAPIANSGESMDNPPDPPLGEIPAAGFEPATFGLGNRPAQDAKQQGLESVTRAARLRNSAERSAGRTFTDDELRASAVEKINRLFQDIRQGGQGKGGKGGTSC